MSGKGRAKDNPFSINSLLKIACILLLVLFVVYFVKTKLDIAKMQEQLVEMEQQVEQREKENKDMQYHLLHKEEDEQEQEEAESEDKLNQSEVQKESSDPNSQQYDSAMERAAREKLDYAYPDERVFVDISGTN